MVDPVSYEAMLHRLKNEEDESSWKLLLYKENLKLNTKHCFLFDFFLFGLFNCAIYSLNIVFIYFLSHVVDVHTQVQSSACTMNVV